MIQLIVGLFVLGFLLYLAETYIPMAEPMKMLVRVVVVFAVCIWLLQVFGVMDMPIPRLR